MTTPRYGREAAKDTYILLWSKMIDVMYIYCAISRYSCDRPSHENVSFAHIFKHNSLKTSDFKTLKRNQHQKRTYFAHSELILCAVREACSREDGPHRALDRSIALLFRLVLVFCDIDTGYKNYQISMVSKMLISWRLYLVLVLVCVVSERDHSFLLKLFYDQCKLSAIHYSKYSVIAFLFFFKPLQLYQRWKGFLSRL